MCHGQTPRCYCRSSEVGASRTLCQPGCVTRHPVAPAGWPRLRLARNATAGTMELDHAAMVASGVVGVLVVGPASNRDAFRRRRGDAVLLCQSPSKRTTLARAILARAETDWLAVTFGDVSGLVSREPPGVRCPRRPATDRSGLPADVPRVAFGHGGAWRGGGLVALRPHPGTRHLRADGRTRTLVTDA